MRSRNYWLICLNRVWLRTLINPVGSTENSISAVSRYLRLHMILWPHTRRISFFAHFSGEIAFISFIYPLSGRTFLWVPSAALVKIHMILGNYTYLLHTRGISSLFKKSIFSFFSGQEPPHCNTSRLVNNWKGQLLRTAALKTTCVDKGSVYVTEYRTYPL